MKHGSFFSFSHPCSLFSVWGRGLWGWAGRPVGVWAVGFLCCCGDRGGPSCPRAGAKGVQLRDRALTTPLGVVVPGSRSIECIWGVWVWVPCPFLCVYMWGEGVYIHLRAWGWERLLVYMVLVRLRLCVRSGLRLHLTHHLSRPPPHHHALPVEDAAGAWWFLAPGQDARVSAGPLSAVAWRGLALLALLGPDWGVGAFGSPGPGPGLPWCGRLPVEPAGLPPRHPGASTLWLSEVTPSGSPLPFSGWRPRLSLRWFSWGSRVLGGPRMFGARIFSMPASCLAGWGCCSPHTLLNIYMEEPYEHSAITHPGVHSSIHIGVKTGAHRPHCLDLLLLQTYFVILVMCCSITFNI